MVDSEEKSIGTMNLTTANLRGFFMLDIGLKAADIAAFSHSSHFQQISLIR
jgi:hypothetical protein